MTDDTEEFSFLWDEADKKLARSETNAEDEERERRDFMSQFRIIASRTIRPNVDRAVQESRSSRYTVTPSQDRDVRDGKVVLRAERPGKVSGVYPGGKATHERLESTLTFEADPARQLVEVKIDGADVSSSKSQDLLLDGIDDHAVRHWIKAFIGALNPKV